MDEKLEIEAKKIFGSNRLSSTPFIRDFLKPTIKNVVILPPSYLDNSEKLRLNEEISPESHLRLQDFRNFLEKLDLSEPRKNESKFRKDFVVHLEQEYLSGRDEQLASAYQGREEEAEEAKVTADEDGPKATTVARIKGVVLRISSKYVSMLSLDGSKEFLVEVGQHFTLLGVKIKVGDVLGVTVNPNLKMSSDLDPELICRYGMAKDEVTTFFNNLKALSNDPSTMLGEFLRSIAIWSYILNEFIVKEDKEKGDTCKNVLEICEVLNDLQVQTQMAGTIWDIWSMFEDSKLFNEALPEIVKDEVWQKANVSLVKIFLENLLKVHPECGIRVVGIMESLNIPEFSQKLFSIIVPYVTGVKEKSKYLKWNQQSVIPLPTELRHDPENDYKDLQSIRVKGVGKGKEKEENFKYSSEEEYIKIYYTLLREECFHKLKKGIYSFLEKGKPDTKDNMIYSIILFDVSDQNHSIQDGLSLVLELINIGVDQTEDSDPDNSKWLMLGNLVCLSLTATFQNPVWGVISKDRTPDDRKLKHVYVSLCTKNNTQKDAEVIIQLQQLKNQGFQAYMIESNTFYPAYGPPLEVLQKKATVPFKEQLVQVSKCTNHDQVPEYLKNLIYKPPNWHVIFEDPPSCKSTNNDGAYDIGQEFKSLRENPDYKPKLDDKQLDAVEHALCNKVALIQGPPGTGKSYVGKALLHLLLSMKLSVPVDEDLYGPILIVTYKNHSLDDFLETFLESYPQFQNHIARVGRNREGTSEMLQQCNLYKLANGTMERNMYQTIKKLESEQTLLKNQMSQCVKDLEESANKFTSSLFIKEADEKHLKFLCKSEEIRKLEKMMRNKRFREEHFEELLKMIKEPLTTWLPSKGDFENFAGLVIKQDQQRREECMTDKPTDDTSSDDSGLEDNCDTQLTEPSDDLEERRDALGEENRKQVEQITFQTQTLTNQDVLMSLPVIPDEKLGNFKSILNAGDIKQLNSKERIQMAYALERKHHKSISNKFLELTEAFSQKQQRVKELRNQHYVNILKKFKVIGMTVSGAAIRASWLESIRPSVMIVEEAAEILESQLVAVIPSSVQHLIMIGDHKQLRPQVHYDVLCRKCNFHFSMFERLIMGELDYTELNKQGRMRDEIAQLVRELGIYTEYKTRDKVVAENSLPSCLTTPMFFFTHTFEVKTQTKSYSKYNIKEAEKVLEVATFLLKHQISPSEITILCSYRGQVNHFNSIFKNYKVSDENSELTAIKVTTIDSFQGKENRFILVSLVCSSRGNISQKEAKIGYLSSINRLCVAISRARCGLYLFGDANLLSDKSKKGWKKVIDLMRKSKCVGNKLSFLKQEATTPGESWNNQPQSQDDKGECKFSIKAKNVIFGDKSTIISNSGSSTIHLLRDTMSRQQTTPRSQPEQDVVIPQQPSTPTGPPQDIEQIQEGDKMQSVEEENKHETSPSSEDQLETFPEDGDAQEMSWHEPQESGDTEPQASTAACPEDRIHQESCDIDKYRPQQDTNPPGKTVHEEEKEESKMQSVEETSEGRQSELVSGAQSEVLSADKLGSPQQDSNSPYCKPTADKKEESKMQSVEETSKGRQSELVSGAESEMPSLGDVGISASCVDELSTHQQDTNLPFCKPTQDKKDHDKIFDDEATCILHRKLKEAPNAANLVEKVQSLCIKNPLTLSEVDLQDEELTVEELIGKLASNDAALKLVNKYIEDHGCNCAACCGIR